MGYYSDVGLAMYKKDFENMLKHFKETCAEAYDTWTKADDYALFENKSDPSNPVIVANIYSTNWYESFDDVCATEDYLHSCCEDDKDICYQFVRIGEDMDDNEEQYNGGLWEYCSINRSIDSDWSPTMTGKFSTIFKQVSAANINELI